MQESGTRIRDAKAGGAVIATRTAATRTDDGKNRVIQLVCPASRQLNAYKTLRGISAMVDAADTEDMTSLPAELPDNIIAIGDTDMVLISVEHTADDGSVTITPIVFDDAEGSNILGMLAPVTSAVGTVKFRRGTFSGNYLSPQIKLATQGAGFLGFHITEIGGTNNAVKLIGGALSEVV